jgi:hypothetical protein
LPDHSVGQGEETGLLGELPEGGDPMTAFAGLVPHPVLLVDSPSGEHHQVPEHPTAGALDHEHLER